MGVVLNLARYSRNLGLGKRMFSTSVEMPL